MTLINLNKARKARAKAEAKAKADANARRFGRTKAEKTQDAATHAKEQTKLDQHKLDRE